MNTPRQHYLHRYDNTVDEFFGTDEEAALRTQQYQKRYTAYDIGQELNALFDDIESGLFGEQAKTGKFYNYVQELKQRFPKP
jgi:hypothetical protein